MISFDCKICYSHEQFDYTDEVIIVVNIDGVNTKVAGIYV